MKWYSLEEKREKDKLEGFLFQTDFKVLQRIREKELGLPLTLSEEEYKALEKERQLCVEKIRMIVDKTV